MTTSQPLTPSEIDARNTKFDEYKANGGDPHYVPESLFSRPASPDLAELSDRPLPSDEDAERLTIGWLLLNPDEIDGAGLVSDDFAHEVNQVAHRELRLMRSTGEPVSPSHLFKRLNEFDEVFPGGPQPYIASVMEGAGAVQSRAAEYVARLKDAAERRHLAFAATSLLKAVYSRTPTADLIEQAAAQIEIVRDEHRGSNSVQIISAGALIDQNPTLHPPRVHGLLRESETANIIASPKIGKSWLGKGLALSVAIGAEWLGKFACEPGRVLLIDNELHQATLANRLRTVADAMGVSPDEYRGRIDVLSLRGRLLDLNGISQELNRVEVGQYDLILLDAFYRSLPPGVSENDNASVAAMYNTIDGIAARLGCAWVNIHHSSKGAQADKSVTDVGAGAGAQSRAADAHITLRSHDEEGCVVFEAVVRSFAPVDPVGLRWTFPVWVADHGLDPTLVRGRLSKGEEKRLDRDQESRNKLLGALVNGPQSVRHLRGVLNVGRERLERLLSGLEVDNAVEWEHETVKGGKAKVYRLKEGGL